MADDPASTPRDAPTVIGRPDLRHRQTPMIRTGYLRWEIDAADERSPADRHGPRGHLPRPAVVPAASGSSRRRREEAAERFVRGEATYASSCRPAERRGRRRGRGDDPRRRPARLPLHRERPRRNLRYWMAKLQREVRPSPTRSSASPPPSPSWSSPARPCGPATPSSSSARPSASSRAGAPPARPARTSRWASTPRPSTGRPRAGRRRARSATWSSRRSSTSSAASTA